jgi:hypothetical protein
MSGGLEPTRTIAELKELRSLTADENGAQRVAFTETWAKAARLAAKKIRRAPRPKDNTIKRVTHCARALRWLVAAPGVKPGGIRGTSIRCSISARYFVIEE